MSDTQTDTPELTVSQKLDALFAPWTRSDRPGLVVGVAHKGETIYRRGFGMASLEHATANTPATRMRIGSTSKHFACFLALLLAEDGKLDINAPVRTYVTELTGPAGDATLRQLMNHTGGARCYLDLGFIGRGLAIPPVGTGLKSMTAQTDRNFPVGEAMIYNNGGYHLLSIAIERAGGAPFEAQLRDRVLMPLGMVDTASVPSDMIITPGAATLHLPNPDGTWRRGIFPSEEVRGEGAMISTIDDMLNWAGRLRSHDGVGSKASWTALTAKPAPSASGNYGLGLMHDSYRGLRTLHHAGGVIGGSSQMLTLPDDDLDIIVIANGALAANPVRLAEQVVDIVLADRVGAEEVTASPETYGELKGLWRSPETGVVYNVLEQDGVLKLGFARSPAGLPLKLKEGGALVAGGGGLSDITVRPSGDMLSVSFGSDTVDYRRPDEGEGAKAAFAKGLAGRYLNRALGIEAMISADGDDLKISVSDGAGRDQSTLEVIDDDLAVPAGGGLGFIGSAITLKRDGGRVTGFELTSMRTRRLPFERADLA
jgi:CubicO group peptidase (beta-lactamase class C family)